MKLSDAWLFDPSVVARESWDLVRANYKMFLKWAVLPLAVQVLSELVFLQLFMQVTGASGIDIKYFISAVVIGSIGVWLSAPFVVRLYRFVVLDELPQMFYGQQLWDKRSWRIIWKSVLVNVQASLLSLVILVLPFTLMAFALDHYGWNSKTNVYQYVVYSVMQPVGSLAVCYLIISRVLLVLPGAAVDSKYVISQYGLLGTGGERRMARTMVLIWWPAVVLQHVVAFGGYFVWNASTLLLHATSLANFGVHFFTAMASMTAAGLIHKRMSPHWAVQVEAWKQPRAQEEDESFRL